MTSIRRRSRAVVKYITTIVFIFVLMLAGRANATLFDRGNGLIYDDVLNITWTQNAEHLPIYKQAMVL